MENQVHEMKYERMYCLLIFNHMKLFQNKSKRPVTRWAWRQDILDEVGSASKWYIKNVVSPSKVKAVF